MLRFPTMLVCSLLLATSCVDSEDAHSPVGVQYESVSTGGTARFVPIGIYLDGGDEQIAAYQFELKVIAGEAEIVGVEGGDLPGFTDPPRYDPAALLGGRIILGAFNTEQALPKGNQRTAVVHMRESGDTKVVYELTRVVTANLNGETVNARAFVSGEGEAQ